MTDIDGCQSVSNLILKYGDSGPRSHDSLLNNWFVTLKFDDLLKGVVVLNLLLSDCSL